MPVHPGCVEAVDGTLLRHPDGCVVSTRGDSPRRAARTGGEPAARAVARLGYEALATETAGIAVEDIPIRISPPPF
jgi:hypothetical protein